MRPNIEEIDDIDEIILNRLGRGNIERNSIKVLSNEIRNKDVADRGVTKDEVQQRCEKLVTIGLAQPVNLDKYTITESGKLYLNGIRDPCLILNNCSIFATLSRSVGMLFLNIIDEIETEVGVELDKLDPGDQAGRAFIYAFSQRFQKYTIFLSALFFISLLDVYMGPSMSIMFYGLLLDGFGALVLVRSVVRGRKGMAIDAEDNYGDFAGKPQTTLNPDAIYSVAFDTVDGIFGGSFLFFGFTIQLLSIIIS